MMNNAVRVLLRDLRRFARVPQAIVILIGIVIIPSLYAWLNIIAFWDPYSNTQHVKVAVVDLDEGATSKFTGELNIGEQVVAQLKDNDQLGWQFLGEDEAMHAVKSGDVYAAIVIGPHFSSDVLSLTTGSFERPKIDYYVNEKANAITPKITDVGAQTLETQINETFVSTVSQTVTEALTKGGEKLDEKLLGAQRSSQSVLSGGMLQLAQARTGIINMGEALGAADTALGDATAALQSANSAVAEVQRGVTEVQGLVATAQGDLASFAESLTSAFVTGSAGLTTVSGKVTERLAEIATAVNGANSTIGGAIGDATTAVDEIERAIDALTRLRDSLQPGNPLIAPLTDALTKLQARHDSDLALLAKLRSLNDEVAQATQAAQGAATALNTAIRDAATSASSVRGILTDTLPAIQRAMNSLSAAAGGLSSALDAQRILIGQASELLGSLGEEITLARDAGTSLDTTLAGVQTDLLNLSADLTALGSADVWAKVESLTALNPKQVADFMASPVKVQEHIVFPVKTYGSAMAPLFTNLSLWIAAFVLVVLIRQEVDTEGIEGLTVRQAYLGRWMLLAVINFFQALLVSVGNVVIGVQMANAFAYVATSVFVGFVYTALIYALAVSFGYVGKGMIILLVIMQIPGASGIYPIQMMPDFFRALFPFFPFTYGIDAMRETIGGFYANNFWHSIAVLVLFAALAFALGLFARQRLGNFARLFNQKLSDTGLFVSEDVQILGSRRRVTQLVEALTNRERFMARTQQQRAWFQAHHLTLLRLALLVWALLTVGLLLLSWAFPEMKATSLGVWGVLCFVTIGFVVALEYVKQNVQFAARVGQLDEAELQTKLTQEERATHSNAVIDGLAEQGRDA